MIYLETVPQDIKVPFILKDKIGNIIDFSSSDSDVDDIKAYLKDENGNLIRSYYLYPDSSDSDKYQIIDNGDKTAYLWVTKADIANQIDGSNIYLGVEVQRTNSNVPEDDFDNSVDLIARFTVKIW